jgi:formylglycine-generating enzyme required for sulfatase activity
MKIALGSVLAATTCVLCIQSLASDSNSEQRVVRGGEFRSVLSPAPGNDSVNVKDFRIDVTPVTNAQFADFLRKQPQWRRDRIARLFADKEYLAHWDQADQPNSAIAEQPVTQVSWFAASAYCEARGGRLPTWYEWEYLAAASETAKDARSDPAWRQRILSWYAKPATAMLPPIGKTPANIYGVRDVHGVVWEWIDDFNSILVSGDNRDQGDPDILKFCGTGALTMQDKDNYAILMRIALFSSLQGHYTTSSLGFRCAHDIGGKP